MTERAARTSRMDRKAHEPLHEAILSRYALLAELAQGELTVVHLALPLGGAGPARPVVLKCLKPQFAHRPEYVQSLRHEAWVSSQLHHAHLTRCLEVIEVDDSCCVVQNYVEGENLANLLQTVEGRSPERFLIPLLVDVLEGLQAVHTALDDHSRPLLLLHGALRARHVLVGVDGVARVTDFSEVQSRCSNLSFPERHRPNLFRHMAPEQVRAPESVDHRSDLFLVGVMLWEGLTGRELFAAASEELTSRHLLDRPVLPPSKVGLRPSPAFDAVCLRALSRDPSGRYDSALAMASALRAAALNAELYANRAEIGAWVRAIVGPKPGLRYAASPTFFPERDDEPTAPFVRERSTLRAVSHRNLT
jgi:eukaryotic-like serine/threonine-protein kinase